LLAKNTATSGSNRSRKSTVITSLVQAEGSQVTAAASGRDGRAAAEDR
jgi:hypothetical protein